MTIIQLRCFAEAAKCLNFGKAAKELYMSQPAVSQHIAALEQELGVKLFVRAGKNIRLSAAGALFLPDAADILGRIEKSANRLTEFNERPSMSIGVASSLIVPGFHEILRKYRKRMPSVELSMVSCEMQELRALFSNEAVDLVFAPREAVEFIPEFFFRPISTAKMYCIVPKEHRLAGRHSLTFTDLNGETMIMLNDRYSPPGMARVLRRVKELCPDIKVLHSDSAALTVTMVAAGYGIAVMPEFVISDKSIVVPVPFELPEYMLSDFEYGIFYRKGEQTEKLKTFINLF